MSTKATTAWGAATVVDEVVLPQRVGEKRFASHVQLLEGPKGESLVRFAYSTGGSARRGPVTLRTQDLAKLRAVADRHPRLAAALGLEQGGDA